MSAKQTIFSKPDDKTIVVPGNESGSWYVDLKNGSGSCGVGNPSTKPDVTLSLNDDVFHQMFQGKTVERLFFHKSKNKYAFRSTKTYHGVHERKNEA